MGNALRPAHYLAIPPSLFETVIQGLGNAGVAQNSGVIVEKPFGRDLASARELNRVAHSVFPEDSIFHIDNFLGKETIMNILYFRFANSFLEPIWNRNYPTNSKKPTRRSLQERRYQFSHAGAPSKRFFFGPARCGSRICVDQIFCHFVAKRRNLLFVVRLRHTPLREPL
jgi:hypothetical protein